MDRGKVGAAAHYLAPPVAVPTVEQMGARLGAYWRALGVTDPDQVAALNQQVLRRLSELPETPGLDPMGRAIVAAGELLDDSLARALDLPQPSPALAAARAALLSGAAPDWPAVLFAPPGGATTAVEELRAALAEPTPAPAPGAMPAQRIDLFWLFGPLRRLLQRVASSE